ncbi:MAG: ATP-binding protein [bacterium]|nr:ATP-binding protein [bacterium]
MLKREYENLQKLLKKGKVTVIYGPRRVGKTTLITNFIKNSKLKCRFDSGDNIETRNIFSSESLETISKYVEGYDLIAIDEAQRIPNVGLGLKILVDNFPNLFVVITGSASLDLSYKIGEPLVGRKYTYRLYPLWIGELAKIKTNFELTEERAERIVFGSYPEVINASMVSEKTKILEENVASYLFKEIVEIEQIGNTKLLLDLLKLIAFQVGNEVSLTELGKSLGVDRKTVQRYLNLFEQAFILYNLRGYNRNLRKEITKKSKYYFWDNGIRNAVIKNFNDLDTRDDVGALWENYLVSERLKKQEYKQIYSNNYFWRTWEGQEIDWVEERGGKVYGFEFKWKKTSIKPPSQWLNTYSNATFETINQENYLEFIK